MRRSSSLALSAWLGLGACGGGGMNLVRTPAVGRADTCPQGAVAIDDRFGPGPTEVRCSYSDAIGQRATTLAGQVRAEDGAIGVGLAEVVVSLHALDGPPSPDAPGPVLADSITDAQGSFHMSVVLDAGDYLLVARDESSPRALAFRRLTLDAATRREVGDLMLWVPVDERLNAGNPSTTRSSSGPLSSPSAPR